MVSANHCQLGSTNHPDKETGSTQEKRMSASCRQSLETVEKQWVMMSKVKSEQGVRMRLGDDCTVSKSNRTLIGGGEQLTKKKSERIWASAQMGRFAGRGGEKRLAVEPVALAGGGGS